MSEEANKTPLFRGANRFRVAIFSGTRKECLVRFPSDAEWCERTRRSPSVQHFLGRGKSQIQNIDTDAVNLELFERIRLDKEGGIAFDAAEASEVIGKLEKARVEECLREGDSFRVTLTVIGARTVHVLRMPTRREMDVYESESVSVINQRRSQEIRGFLEPAGELYGKIRKSVEGYDGEVPIVHRFAVINEVLAQLTVEDEEPVPEA